MAKSCLKSGCKHPCYFESHHARLPHNNLSLTAALPPHSARRSEVRPLLQQLKDLDCACHRQLLNTDRVQTGNSTVVHELGTHGAEPLLTLKYHGAAHPISLVHQTQHLLHLKSLSNVVSVLIWAFPYGKAMLT